MKTVIAWAIAFLLLSQPDPYYWGDGVDWIDTQDYEESMAICRAVRERMPATSHFPPAGSAIDPEGCDSSALYYGIGRPPDPVQARLCAFREAQLEQSYGDWPFAGRAMLMTIYANGSGVPRDLDLAIRYACEIDSAPAEVHARVMHLAAMRDSPGPDEFHYCDHITSSMRAGQCASFHAQFADLERERRRAALTASWSDEERAALARLDDRFSAFEDAVTSGELDMTGTLRIALLVDVEQRLRDEHLAILEHLESRRALPYVPAQLSREDARLNAVYRATMAEWRADAGLRCCGAPTADGLREAQRAWIRYRDAFTAFAALRYPDVPTAALNAWLTAARTDTLENPLGFDSARRHKCTVHRQSRISCGS